MIKRFSIPDYYNKYEYIVSIIRYMKEFPQEFYPDRIIDSSYGAHPDIMWTGGRIPKRESYSTMPDILSTFNQFPEVELRHVCTNFFITDDILYDYKTNYIMQHFLRSQDKLIVANDTLIQYIKKTYPNDIIYSTTMNITDINQVNKITKNNIYVLNYNYNNDDKYLKQLKYPHNIEVLCAEPCDPNCSNRVKHYEHVSRVVLGLEEPEDFICPNQFRMFDDVIKLPNTISSERVNELANMGIRYFKISGRNLKLPDWLAYIIYYLALPEYRTRVYLKILNEWW